MKQFLTNFRLESTALLSAILPLLLVALTAAPAWATGVTQIPDISTDPSTWVVDQADVISRINEGKLNRALKELAQQSGNEVKMVVVRRLNYGETIDSFADKLFARWYPTPEDQANKTLLVFDTITNNAAIRRGEATQALLSDEIAQSIVTDTIGVPIRKGDKYNQAFLGAEDRLVAVLSGQPDPGPPEVKPEIQVEGTFTPAEETDSRSSTIWVVSLLVAATVIPMATYFAYVIFSG